VWHENCFVQLHLKSKVHFGKIETTFGTCKLHVLYFVSAYYMRYIWYLQTTCTTFCICILHALHSVPANYTHYVLYLHITCIKFGIYKLHVRGIFFLFITVSSFFCYFNRLNPTGKYTNCPNIMKISVFSNSVHLFFV
jgi:hypothetical protein